MENYQYTKNSHYSSSYPNINDNEIPSQRQHSLNYKINDEYPDYYMIPDQSRVGMSGGNRSAAFQAFSPFANSLFRDYNPQYPVGPLETERDKANGFFFESPSKYISLKKFKQSCSFSFSPEKEGQRKGTKGIDRDSIFDDQELPRGLNIMQWFESLSLPDKSIVLTTVDKQMVSLLKKLYKYYQEHGNGKFNNINYPSHDEADKTIRVEGLQLLFQIPKYKKGVQCASHILRKLQEAEESLINAVRIISINEDCDAFTLDIEFFRSTTFFLEIMRIATGKQFLCKELKLVKDSSRLQSSVLVSSKENQSLKNYWTCVPSTMDNNKPQDFTLGQCLAFLIEKAINLQYYEYAGKMTKDHQHFFFTEYRDNVFQFDQKLTKYWISLSQDKRNNIFKQINEIETILLKDEHIKKPQCQQIKEEDYDYDDDRGSNDGYDDRFYGRNQRSSSLDLEEQRPYYRKYAREEEDEGDYYVNSIHSSAINHHTTFGDWSSPLPYNHLDKNSLFGQSQNIFFKSKMKITTAGKDASTEEQAFCYIKSVSGSVTLDQTRPSILNMKLLKKFYQILLQDCEQSLLDDLMLYDEKKQGGTTKNTNSTTNAIGQAAKKNKKKKKKGKQDKDSKQPTTTQQELTKHQTNQAPMSPPLITQTVLSVEDELYQMKKQIEERTSLLTGEIMHDKYTKDEAESESTTMQTNKKKKRKNKKKSKGKQQQEDQQVTTAEEGSQKDDDLKIQTSNNVHYSINHNDEDDDLESILIDDIAINVDEEKDSKHDSDRKINNFVAQVHPRKTEDYTGMIELKELKKEGAQTKNEYDDEEQTKQVVREVTADLCNRVIFSIEDKAETPSKSVQQPLSEKQKKKKNKKSKKQQNKTKTEILLKQTPPIEETPLHTQETIDYETFQSTPQEDQDYQIEQEETHQLESKSQRNSQRQKRVAFKVEANSHHEDVKVPQRGNNKGYTGTEEVHHQETITVLDELFPVEYKNPSDTTRSKIGEITHSIPESEETYQENYQDWHYDQYQEQDRDQYHDQYKYQYKDQYNDQYKDQYYDQHYDQHYDHYQGQYQDQYQDQYKDQYYNQYQESYQEHYQESYYPQRKQYQQQQQYNRYQDYRKDNYDYQYQYKNEYRNVYQKKKPAPYRTRQTDTGRNYQTSPPIQTARTFCLKEETKQQQKTTSKEVKSKSNNKIQLPQFDNYEAMFQTAFEEKQEQKEATTPKDPLEMVTSGAQTQPEQKPKKKRKKEKRDLQEKGISVNPDQIQNANKKHKKRKSKQLEEPIQESQPIVEQRSQTPNEANQSQTYGPLEEALLQDNYFVRGSNLHKFSTQSKSKKPKVQHSQLSCQPQQLEQLLAFDQQQQQHQQMMQQELYQQNMMNQPFFYNPLGLQMMPQYFMGQQIPPMTQMPNSEPSTPLSYNIQFQNQPQPTAAPPVIQTTHTEAIIVEDKQTDKKAANESNASNSSTPSPNLHVMMNQYQNINIQVHLPPPQTMPQYQSPMMTNSQPYTPQVSVPGLQSPQLNQSDPYPLVQTLLQQWLQSNQTQPTPYYPMNQSQQQQYMQYPNQQNQMQWNQSQQNQQQWQQKNMHQNSNSNGGHHSQHNSSSGRRPVRNQYHSQHNVSNGYLSHQQSHHQHPNHPQNFDDRFYEQLDKEIKFLSKGIKKKLQQNDKERIQAFELLQKLVSETYPGLEVKVQMYGSMATGLAIDSSDMDVLVSGAFSTEGPVDRALLIDQMKKLHKQLNSLVCLESNSLIETASVPVIKIVLDLQKLRDNNYDDQEGQRRKMDDDMQHLKMDITFNDQQSDQYYNYNMTTPSLPIHMGIKCCQFIRQMLKEYPLLEQLTIAMKKFLAVKNLNSPFLGGLSSYGLVLIIIAFLNNDLPEMYEANGEICVGRTLAHLLFFYGKVFDPSMHMVNEHMMITQQYNFSSALTILDPLNPANNIGKSTYNFDQIRFELSTAHDRLVNIYNSHFTEALTDSEPLSILPSVLSVPVPTITTHSHSIKKHMTPKSNRSRKSSSNAFVLSSNSPPTPPQ